jgi:hypothetical protein
LTAIAGNRTVDGCEFVGSGSHALHGGPDRIDQDDGPEIRCAVLDVVHHVAEGESGCGVGEAERTAETGKPEGSRGVPERVGCGQDETGADPDGYAKDAVDPARLCVVAAASTSGRCGRAEASRQ